MNEGQKRKKKYVKKERYNQKDYKTWKKKDKEK